MNYGNERTVELYIDFLWQTIDYWKNIAAANKEDLEYYRGIVDKLIECEVITLEQAVELGDELEDERENGNKEGE